MYFRDKVSFRERRVIRMAVADRLEGPWEWIDGERLWIGPRRAGESALHALGLGAFVLLLSACPGIERKGVVTPEEASRLDDADWTLVESPTESPAPESHR